MNKPIQLYIISGFLGAGKTTFLRKMLETLEGERVGLIINEFGSIGMDGVEFKRGEIKLLEINGGSIFCACLKKGFVRALTAFSKMPVDIMVIENSGMADPGGMNTLLSQLAPYLERQYNYRGMISMIDAVTFADYVDVLTPVYNQAALADLLIINKTDLVDENDLIITRRLLREISPDAIIYETTYGQVPSELVRELVNSGRDARSSNTPYNRPAAYLIKTDEIVDTDRLRAFCSRLESRLLRMKGYIRAKQGNVRVEVVCGQIEMLPSELRQSSYLLGKLVLIGKSAEPFDQEIERAWEESVSVAASIKME